MKTYEKSNEITAIPEILELLSLKGMIVTIDAMGCRKKIAQEITEKHANYLFSLKGNHETALGITKASSPVMNLIKNPVKSMEYRNLTARQKSDMEELKNGNIRPVRKLQLQNRLP